MITPGSDCWGRAPVTPHSPAHSKISCVISYTISYMISYHIKDFICNIIHDIDISYAISYMILISYHMKHINLTVLSPKAVSCQVEVIASCLWPPAVAQNSKHMPSVRAGHDALVVVQAGHWSNKGFHPAIYQHYKISCMISYIS